jgi:hypothetical protein
MKTIVWVLLALPFTYACSGGSDDTSDDPSGETDADESDPDDTDPDDTDPSSMTKPTATTIKFAANGVDCGLTDGFADQQHSLPELIHLNTDKCNGETFRPTFTLRFEAGKTIELGTYSVAAEGGPMEVQITSEQYNYTSWDGTSGSVIVTQNADDSSKLDLELDAIVMTNRTPDDTMNPSTDTVTGYIIGI